jgi:hypothetical protein
MVCERAGMMAWLPVAGLVIVQIAVRLIGVAGIVWRERARAKSHCAQMRAASAARVVLYAQEREGARLLIIPRDLAGGAADGTAMTAGLTPREEGPAS